MASSTNKNKDNVQSQTKWISNESVHSPLGEIQPVDVVWIPPGEKHWHDAISTTAMTHIAIQGGRLRGSSRVRDDDRHRCPHLHSRGTGHECVRALRRRRLPHLLRLRARPRRALGDVPVARPGAEGAQRDRAVVAAARRIYTRFSIAVAMKNE
jgi:hypothetical protein